MYKLVWTGVAGEEGLFRGVSLRVCVCSVSQLCLTLCAPWSTAHQAPLSMGFSRQEYGSGLLFPSPGDFPNPGIEPWAPGRQIDYHLSYQGSFSQKVQKWSINALH